MAKSFPVIEPKEGLKQKGLTRAILKDYQITFNENVYSRDPAPPESSDKAVSAHSTKQDASRSDPLPVHIEEVRRRLLDFKSIVPSSKKVSGHSKQSLGWIAVTFDRLEKIFTHRIAKIFLQKTVQFITNTHKMQMVQVCTQPIPRTSIGLTERTLTWP